jgi:vancomycin resistance protein VanJ
MTTDNQRWQTTESSRPPTGPPPRRRRSSRSRGVALLLTLVALSGLVAVVLIEHFVAERHLMALMLTYAPPVIYVAPIALLGLVCLGLGQRGLGMFNLLLTAGAVMMFMTPVFPRPPAVTPGLPTVRVVTWNVHEEFRRTAEITQALAGLQADIICLQEARRKPFQAVGGPHWDRAHQGELTTLTRGKIVAERSFMMAQIPSKRYALETVIELPQGGRVTVLNVHFHSFHSPWRPVRGTSVPNLPEVTRRTREAELQRLLAWVTETPGPKVIAGDFNTPPRGLIYRRLSRSLANAFAVSGRGFGYTYRRGRPLLRIDHIWVADGPQPVGCQVIDGGVSDHLLLQADLVCP